ncbi:DUF6913 domain-containing protein [Christiangramia portivictoriae]|uniref:DUF6913 domain-containing protein n=1 Tax=Christiangramia portivictoriae TaxID=326069 RepID=UPI0004034A10|nr:hypothetical protein [Christiangramia portivictoriae]
MITNKIKSVQLKKAIGILKENRQVGSANSNRVLLVIAEDHLEDYGSISEVYLDLGVPQQDFHIIICGSASVETAKNMLQIGLKDIGIDGSVSNKELATLLEHKFGLAIVIAGEEALLAYYVASKSQAALLIGNSPDPFSILDIEISENDASLFEAELIRYYRIIKNK